MICCKLLILMCVSKAHYMHTRTAQPSQKAARAPTSLRSSCCLFFSFSLAAGCCFPAGCCRRALLPPSLLPAAAAAECPAAPRRASKYCRWLSNCVGQKVIVFQCDGIKLAVHQHLLHLLLLICTHGAAAATTGIRLHHKVHCPQQHPHTPRAPALVPLRCSLPAALGLRLWWWWPGLPWLQAGAGDGTSTSLPSVLLWISLCHVAIPA